MNEARGEMVMISQLLMTAPSWHWLTMKLFAACNNNNNNNPICKAPECQKTSVALKM